MSETRPIQQSNPAAGYAARKDRIDAAIARVLSSGWYVLGKEVSAFEAEFAHFVGAAHGIGVASGTDALELALRALGVGPGHGVLTVSHTAVATVAAIERAGATPVLVDIDPETATMSPESLETAANRRWPGIDLRAVVPVHLYGHPADMPAILEIAAQRGLAVVEDCAQAHGASLDDRAVGTFGVLAAFSFYPTKNLAAFGDGGMIVTSDDGLAANVRRLRQYGWEPKFISQEPGVNSRLDELQAAVLRDGLTELPTDNERRRAIARRYDARLAHTAIERPTTRPTAEHVYHQYVVRTRGRDALRAYLERNSIGTAVHYPQAVHAQPAYAGRLPRVDDLGVTDLIVTEILSLPMHPWLSDADVDRVCGAIGGWLSESGEPWSSSR